MIPKRFNGSAKANQTKWFYGRLFTDTAKLVGHMQVKRNDCGWYNENVFEMKVQKPDQKSQQLLTDIWDSLE